jgi:hypothetical protein
MQRTNLLSNQKLLNQESLANHKPGSSAIRTAKKRSASRQRSQTQAPVPALFAEGVDVGVELALRWMEAELVHGEASPSVEKALNRIRQQARQARQSSFLQQTLDTSATRPARSRRTLSSTRARSARSGTRKAVI